MDHVDVDVDVDVNVDVTSVYVSCHGSAWDGM